MKTICTKSWPGNLFHVLKLTFDPCFKVVTLKRPYFSHIIGAVASGCKDRQKQRLWSKIVNSFHACVHLFVHPSVHPFVRFQHKP